MPKGATQTILDRWQKTESPAVLRPARRAIRTKCLDCCGNQQAEVAKCTAWACPLWPYRFGQGATPKAPSAWVPSDADIKALEG